jgi:hypothetical protein
MKTSKFLVALALLLAIAQGTWAEGELTGRFTVNASGKQVCFSQGNLQATYDGSAWSWALAENQWDYIGNAAANTSINGNGTVSANGTVDLFGWVGTSNETWTGAAQYGISNSIIDSHYGDNISDNLKSNWGTLIGTGWRTLTYAEWEYLFSTRTTGGTVGSTAQARYTHATINTDGTSVNGMILFPDGVDIANTTDYFTTLGTVNGNSDWGTKCTSAQWTALAAKGCVFLPAAGYRGKASVQRAGTDGYYWSSSNSSWSYWATAETASNVHFSSSNLTQDLSNRYNGYSVRLVKDCHTVTFDIDDYDDDPATQIVAHGMKATEPTSNRDGYHVSVWKLGEDDYDFNTPVTSDITLTAEWTANTYTVAFDSNGGSGTMANMNQTYDGSWATLTAFDLTAPDTYLFGRWNTKADGSGTSYDNEDWVRNLTTENGATVTLYAQWAKDIDKWCTAEVPNQAKSAYSTVYDCDRDYAYIYNKFDEANWPASYGISVGETVKDDETTLTLGTDYMFGNVYYSNMTGMNEPENVGDECLVEIIGIGDYAGILYAPFRIIVPDADGTWGNLKWVYSDGTLTISKKDGVEDNVVMPDGDNYDDFDWKGVASGVFTLTIGEGITNVGEYAFGSNNGVEHYGNLTTINLPTTLTTIGENAFAYCVGLTVDLDAILAENISIGNRAFYQIGCLTGSLADKTNNDTKIALLSQANANVTLSGRTLYKDNNWNTICLPFSLGDGTADEGHHFDGTPLEGATVMKLNRTDSEFDASTGILTLTFVEDNSITAGTPYIIKWASGDNLVNPVFTGVRVLTDDPSPAQSADEKVQFCGKYSPAAIGVGDNTNLFLGTKKNAQDEDVSTLFYPNATNYLNFPNLDPAATSAYYYLGAFRAYFQLNPQQGGGDVRGFVLNFGEKDDADGIGSIQNSNFKIQNEAGAVYNLSGQRLSKPQKGINIINGKKVLY